MIGETLDRLEAFVERTIWKYRLGYYRATVSTTRTLRRVDVDPEWCETPIRNALRISSPVLDIIPAAGTMMAIASQDGVPEAAAVLGQLWDENNGPADMTVWFRADLQEHPGHVELGATNSIRLFVGANPEDITPATNGKIVIGNGTVELLAIVDRLLAALQTATAGGYPLITVPAGEFAAVQAELAQIKE